MTVSLRVLFATTSGAGHFGPMAPFAAACREAGHTVAVAAPASLGPVVERAGFVHLPFDDAPPEELGAVFGRLHGASNHEGNETVVREVFGRINTRSALPGMRAIVAEWRPDVILREGSEFSSYMVAETTGIPHAEVAVGLAGFEREFLPYAFGPLEELGATGLDGLLSTTRLTLVPESLEAAEGFAPGRTFRFRDPGVAVPEVARLPDWWPGAAEPLVYVSFGTVAPTLGLFPSLYSNVIDSLAGVPVRVLVTIGDGSDPAALLPLPPNVHVEPWWSQRDVMPLVAAIVGHGGFGTTLAGLAAGRPMVVLPLFADQPYNAARVEAAGAGIALEGGVAAAGLVGEAVLRILDDPSYAQAAAAIAAEMAALPPASEVVPVVEELAQRR